MVFKYFTVQIFISVTAFNVFCNGFTPIVMWHGMGDFSNSPHSMGKIKERLEKDLPGVHVLSLRIGNSSLEDILNGFMMHPDKQIEIACDTIRSDPRLSNGYNAIGMSQGALFLRGLAQRCSPPLMKNLVSVGGLHQGVFGVPKCDETTNPLCAMLRGFISKIAYHSFFQDNVVQATFWHDPMNKTSYRERNSFVADINNELYMNSSYISNLQALENMVMIMFESDDMIKPKESSWFRFYKPGQFNVIENLEETDTYLRLGLNEMHAKGALHFLSLPGNHLQLDWPWFVENVINKFLNK